MMMFVLGMLAWQVITMIVYIATGKDKEKTLLCGRGVCGLVASEVDAIIYAIRLRKYRKYNLYQFFDCEGEWMANFYMTEQDAERFNLIERNAYPIPYCVRLYRAGYEYKCIPPKNEILTAEMIKYGVPTMFLKSSSKKLDKTLNL